MKTPWYPFPLTPCNLLVRHCQWPKEIRLKSHHTVDGSEILHHLGCP